MPVVSDDFAGTGALSANWTTAIGTLARSSDELAGSTADYNIAWWDADSFADDHYSEMTMGTYGASSYGVLAVRCSGSGGTRTMYVYSFSGAAVNADLFRVVNNVSTKVVDMAESFGVASPGDTVRLEVEGSGTSTVVRVLINGVEAFSYTDTSGSAIASGAPGVGTFRADSRVLDWEGGDDAGGGGGSAVAALAYYRKLLGG